MILPFVSRGRYDDAARQIEELKDEREILIDRILVLTGQKPLYERVVDVAAPAPPVSDKEVLQMPDMPVRRPSMRELILKGNKDARARAESGAEDVHTELARAATTGRKIANGN